MTYFLIALGLLLVGILVYAATKPDRVHYVRSATINAAPERILPHLIDFHEWMPWSPYEKLDPAMQRTYSGAAEGKGAKYAWDSKERKAGAGSMEIIGASPTSVDLDLKFTRPFKSYCLAKFELVPQGTATQVSWSLDGPNPYISKLMGLFMSFDKMIGKDFEDGLAGLKKIAEQ